MNDFTITTVGRKEVPFTFEDAMYVAAAVYKFNGVKKMPFGPWLCAGIFAAALYGEELTSLYLNFIRFVAY